MKSCRLAIWRNGVWAGGNTTCVGCGHTSRIHNGVIVCCFQLMRSVREDSDGGKILQLKLPSVKIYFNNASVKFFYGSCLSVGYALESKVILQRRYNH